MATSEPLKLAVLDDEDLRIMSTHLQDARVRVSDIAYLPKQQRFALAVARIDWDNMIRGRSSRRDAGFHFERVTRVQRSGFDQADAERMLDILTISFTPTEEPAGEVVVLFSGGAMVKLTVECLEAEMRDLGEPWPCSDCPKHPLDANPVPV